MGGLTGGERREGKARNYQYGNLRAILSAVCMKGGMNISSCISVLSIMGCHNWIKEHTLASERKKAASSTGIHWL